MVASTRKAWVATAIITALVCRASLTIDAGPATANTLPVAASPLDDSFYSYDGTTPLPQLKPGTVLKTRTLAIHVAGVPLPLTAVQLLYRSTSATGGATVNVTSVIRPPVQRGPVKALAYGSAYDSLNPADEPSAVIAGSRTFPGSVAYQGESAVFVPLLLAGYTVVVSDTQGQQAAFAAGPLYGMNTLDSLRAATRSPVTGLNKTTRIGLVGYSGGAIAAQWAAELAPRYAPEVARNVVGTAIGGVLVDPLRNLRYVNGSRVWSGILPMALVGLQRAYHVDVTPYLNGYGRSLLAKMQKASILSVLGAYPGLTWAKIAKPGYPSPASVPAVVKIADRLVMGSGGTPTAPMFIGQGIGGTLEGTMGNKRGIGAGDGVMIAGDVRTLARTYCTRGVSVSYRQYPLSHFTSVPEWAPQALEWMQQRFAGQPAPANCGSIPPGNQLARTR